jgi:glycosyltransferase involved in cell wall biosynthesis
LLAQLWSHCGAYFHGHSAGGTNPALLQALGHGAPTIALDTPFNHEVIDNPAQLVPRDPKVLAGRLQELVDDGDLRRRYAKLGQSRIRDGYSWDEALAAYRDVLLHLAARSGARPPTKQTAS